jgi:hypothetical protein
LVFGVWSLRGADLSTEKVKERESLVLINAGIIQRTCPGSSWQWRPERCPENCGPVLQVVRISKGSPGK